MDVKQLDLKMLHFLQVLVAERHVTKAAVLLGITQPRLSSILSKLRQLTGDPILVKTPSGLAATPYALSIAQHSRSFMEKLEELDNAKLKFHPETAHRLFRIAAQDHLVQACVLPLIKHIRTKARGICIAVNLPLHVIDNLRSGAIDLAIGYIDSLPAGFYVTTLGRTKRVCIASASHKNIRGKMTLAQFAAAEHVVMTYGDSCVLLPSEQVLENALNAHGISRRIGSYVPSFHLMPELVADSDMISVVPLFLAQRARILCNIQIHPLPFSVSNPDVTMVWHERLHNDAAHKWVRSTIKKNAKHFELDQRKA
jgi:DNA-binding transcriptional LysR family regulator